MKVTQGYKLEKEKYYISKIFIIRAYKKDNNILKKKGIGHEERGSMNEIKSNQFVEINYMRTLHTLKTTL